jgi:hypothetical protein
MDNSELLHQAARAKFPLAVAPWPAYLCARGASGGLAGTGKAGTGKAGRP